MSDTHDPVNHPKHYTSRPSGVECIQITRHMSFNLGNVVKYLWRADEKGAPLEDLKKAAWYLADEIKRREGEQVAQPQPDADGWIEWHGGDCPVAQMSVAEVRFRNNTVQMGIAGHWDWTHGNRTKPATGGDIIAYRVVK